MKKVFFALHWLFMYSVFAQSWEGGIPMLKNYSPVDYKAYSQNWCVIENNNHLLLVANGDGILIYDATHWEKIILPNYITPIALVPDKNNFIWVGAFGEIGFLKPSILHGYEYVSLLPLIPPRQRSFDFVKEIVRTNDKVVFNAHDKLYVLSVKGMQVIPVTRGGFLCQLHDQALYIANSGIYKVEKQSLIKLQPASPWITQISTSFQISADTLLVWDEANGLLLLTFHGRLMIKKLFVPIEEILKRDEVRHFIKLNLGGYAFATERNGTYLVNNQFKLITHLSRETGLINETHNCLHEDKHGNLWIAMDYGLAKINLHAPLFLFNYAKGIKGSVLDVVKIKNKIYAGTWQGLFIRDLYQYGQYFLQDPYITSQVWKFLPLKINNTPKVIIATSNGLYQIDTAFNISIIDKQRSYYLTTISEPDSMVVSASRLNIRLYPIKTMSQAMVIDVSDNIRSIVGINDKIYVSTYTGKLFCYTVYLDKKSLFWRVSPISTNTSQKDELKLFFRFGKKIVLSTRKGLYFVKDTSLYPVFSKVNLFQKYLPTYYVSYLKYENDSTYWIQLESKELGHRIFSKIVKQNQLYYPYVLTYFPSLEILNIYNDGDSLVWIATDEGVFCYDRRLEFKKKALLHDKVIITKVYLNDQLIYNGISNSSNLIQLGDISYGKNVLRIHFTSDNFIQEDLNVFLCKLEGYDKKWIPLGKNHVKEYNQLPPGKYTFLLKSVSQDGATSEIKTMTFYVTYPWYLKWWAVIFELLLLAGIVATIAILINRRLIQIKNRLEKQVQERTREIELRNKEIELEKEKSDFLLFNILPVKVAEELKSKGQFVPIKITKAAVVFTDFVRFSLLSDQYSSEELVEKLDYIFSRFDDICSRYQLEKIKTIGDSHMSVGGLPVFSKTYAIDAALAALEMVDFIEYLNSIDPTFKPWKVRIGIHVGNLIAGIVGKRKFGFDVWGSTVNMASRLQEASLPNKINVSKEFAEEISAYFMLTYRGKIPVKHQGEVDMYFLERLKPEYSIDEKGYRPNQFFKLKYVDMIEWKHLNL